MKKNLALFAALIAVASMSAQTIDTVKVIDQPSQVIITETSNGSKIEVKGVEDKKEYTYTYKMDHAPNDSVHVNQSKDFELKYPFSKSDGNDNRKSHWAIIGNGLYLGFGNCSMPEISYTLDFGILNIAAIEYDSHHGQEVSLGIGFNLKEYYLKRDYCFVRDHQSGILGIGSYPDGIKNDYGSALGVRSLQFPLWFRQRIYKKLKFNVGAIMNWNLYASCNTHYKLEPYAHEKVDYDIHLNGLNQQKLTLDLFGGLSCKGIGLYFRYSPQELFEKGFAPEIKNTWSVGLILGL